MLALTSDSFKLCLAFYEVNLQNYFRMEKNKSTLTKANQEKNAFFEELRREIIQGLEARNLFLPDLKI